MYISEDKKKWTIPTLLTVKDIAADEFATSRLLLYGSICAVGFVLYKIVTKRMKKKKGRKHKDDNPLLEEIHPHVKKSKKHSQVKEREVKETV